MTNLTKMSKGFEPDYYDFIFNKLLNLLMKDGKKRVALKIITKSISKAKKHNFPSAEKNFFKSGIILITLSALINISGIEYHPRIFLS